MSRASTSSSRRFSRTSATSTSISYNYPDVERDGQWHKVRLEVVDGDYEVRVRPGYRLARNESTVMKGRAISVAFGTAVAALAVATGGGRRKPPRDRPSSLLSIACRSTSTSSLAKASRSKDLTAADFSLTVDGQAAAHRLAQLSRLRARTQGGETGRRHLQREHRCRRPLDHVSHRPGDIGAGRGRPAMESAIRFVAQLSAADKRRAADLAGRRPQIDFTRNHALVSASLPQLSGQADTHPPAVPDRPCRGAGRPAGGSQRAQSGDRARMRSDPPAGGSRRLPLQRRGRLSGIAPLVHERTQHTLGALRSLLDRLSQTTSPKTLVLVSEGLLLERVTEAHGLESRRPRRTSTIQVLHLDVAGHAEASAVRELAVARRRSRVLPGRARARSPALAEGEVFRSAATADFAFQRLSARIVGVLPSELRAGTGRPRRQGPPDQGRRPRRRDLTSALAQRVQRRLRAGATDRGAAQRNAQVAAARDRHRPEAHAYTLQDPDSSKLSVLVIADIDRSANPEGHVGSPWP